MLNATHFAKARICFRCLFLTIWFSSQVFETLEEMAIFNISTKIYKIITNRKDK